MVSCYIPFNGKVYEVVKCFLCKVVVQPKAVKQEWKRFCHNQNSARCIIVIPNVAVLKFLYRHVLGASALHFVMTVCLNIIIFDKLEDYDHLSVLIQWTLSVTTIMNVNIKGLNWGLMHIAAYCFCH